MSSINAQRSSSKQSSPTLQSPESGKGDMESSKSEKIAKVTQPKSSGSGSLVGETKAFYKYAGYRKFTKWLASDQANFVIRRFGALNIRVILRLQDKIVQLEEELEALDTFASQSCQELTDEDETDNGTFRHDPLDSRIKLISGSLKEALQEYNTFVNAYSLMSVRPTVKERDADPIRIWLRNHSQIDESGNITPETCAISDPEAAYMVALNPSHAANPEDGSKYPKPRRYKYQDDLIAVFPKDVAPLRRYVHNGLFRLVPKASWTRRIFTQRRCDYDDGATIWSNEGRVGWLTTLSLASFGLAMLICPLWWLNFVSDPAKRLGIITGFIVLFFFLVLMTTLAQIFEVLAATAAYSAVLMVFMQIGGGLVASRGN